MTIPVLLDTDPGIDDCLALLLACASPELEVRQVVTVFGNTTLGRTTRNAAEILRRAGSALRPGPGSDRPLARSLVTAEDTHGPSGLGHAAVPPEKPVSSDPLALYQALVAQQEPVVLVTLGPLTNLAHALRADAELVRRRVRRHLAMAGNLDAPGNTTAVSEFNAWCDPEAADLVARGGLSTEWVGLDVTRRLVLEAEAVERLDRDEHQRWLRDTLRFYVEFHREHEGLDGCVVNDPIPIAALLEPGLLTLEEVPLRVSLEEGERRGQTARMPGAPLARFATQVRADRVRRLLDERVLSPARPLGS